MNPPTLDNGTPERVNMLIVDDQPRNIFTLREVLSPLNQNLMSAGSGKEALKLILQYKFAVVLLDVKMPDISGYDVALLMRKRAETKETPIIFITGYGDSSPEIRKGYELGAVDYLIKPVEPHILLSKVKVFVDLHRKTVALEHQKEIALAELRKNLQLSRTNSNLEQMKREAEQFAYIASHDLQTPLRHIGSFIEVLRDPKNGPLNDTQSEAVEIIADGASRMKSLVRGLLDLSRLGRQSLIRSKVPMQDVVDDAVKSLKEEIKASGAEVLVDSLPSIVIDRDKMKQVIENLIANGIKYRGEHTPEISIGATRQANGFIFHVRDNGIGISEKHYNRIFEMFQRLHTERAYPGTGIGLAICKKIVELHNGDIWVESVPGAGSSFYFSIPDMDESKKEHERSKDSGGGRPGSRPEVSPQRISTGV